MSRLFIFIGRPGCGKGTQAELLEKVLKTREPDRPILRIETGKLFREFVASSQGYTRDLACRGLERGDRLPDFLSIWNWGRMIVERFTGQENIIFDGAPRSLIEAQMFDTLIKFYPDLQPVIIFLNLSRETAKARLESRGRADDHRGDKRLDWFDQDVLPAVKYLQTNPLYKFLDIDGEPTVEKIHQDIVSRL